MTRDLLRQVVVYAEDGGATRAELSRLLLAFYHLCVQRLRGEDDLDALERYLTPGERTALADNQHRAAIVAIWLTARIRGAIATGDERVTELRLSRIDPNLSAMLEVLGGCERIRATPIPFAYAQHIKMFLALFCYTAPFSLVHDLGVWTPVAAAALALALFGIDEIGVEIEHPFGHDDNDIPLDTIGQALERVAEEMSAVSIGDAQAQPAGESTALGTGALPRASR